MDSIKEYRIDLKIRNNLILSRMQEIGIKSLRELAERAKVGITDICKLVNLKQTPLKKSGEWRASVYRIAAVLQRTPHELFSAEQCVPLPTNRAVVEVTYEELNHAILASQADPLEILAQDDAAERLRELIDERLSPRQAGIIRRRFGFDGAPKTREEIAKEFAVTTPRIRQIEEDAIRKLMYRNDELLELLTS